MMFAELIDEQDFRERLLALGIDVPSNADPDTCARLAAQQHACRAVPGLPALVAELETQAGVVLPEVRQSIERYLRPALG